MRNSTHLFAALLVGLYLLLQASVGLCQATCPTAYTFQGEVAQDRFGKAVASAGDVDHDGFADLIVGAWGSDAAGADAGRAYVYSGQTGAMLHTFTGSADGDNLGWSVSAFTDVNSDGYPDVAVGAPKALGVGQVYVYSGMDGSLLQTLTGPMTGDDFGWSVSPAGDVNMDGIEDLLVGAPSLDGGNPGRAYVYSGADYSELYAFDGNVPTDEFGHSVSAAGDVNLDGFDDVIIGAPQNDDGGSDAGSAYVFSGQSGALLFTMTGEGAQHYFGYSVGGGVDLNGDTHDDVIVGATGAAAAGKTYAYSGQDGSLLFDLTGESADDQFGWSVAGLGDITGDGKGDLVVGAKFNNDDALNAGKVYVYSGANGSLYTTFIGVGIRRNLGTAVANAGDVNGDGLDDIIAGGPRRGAGLAHVYTCLPPPHIPTLSDAGAVTFGAVLLILLTAYVRRMRVQHA